MTVGDGGIDLPGKRLSNISFTGACQAQGIAKECTNTEAKETKSLGCVVEME